MKEFDLINKYFAPLTDVSDDCAFFEGWCFTKDVLVSGVHFFATDGAFNLARKALRVNLSDLASSGAKPFGFMLGLALPRVTNEKWMEEFSAGLKSDIEKYGIRLLGGDTVFHDGELVISITAIGRCEKPVVRSGAKIGDNIFVSGAIGGGFVGLREKMEGIKGKGSEKYELPEPRVELGLKLAEFANASIDISDSLLADLGHVCVESGVGAEIDSKAIPLFDATGDLMAQITGGDDYELLFTSSLDAVDGCSVIGKIVAGDRILLDGKQVVARGYEHKSV